jgi:GNAT superfamily N-acetyltransferase
VAGPTSRSSTRSRPDGDFNAVTGRARGRGARQVPTWLRPYFALSNGEKFRADLARLICEAPEHAVVDEFTSVVDRQIAKFGALAFQKAWRAAGQVVLLTCTTTWSIGSSPIGCSTRQGQLLEGGPSATARVRLSTIGQTDGRYWPLFEPHHYLKLPRMIGCAYYVGTVDGELACHMGVSTKNKGKGVGAVEARACRLVVMPEWQGAGVGLRFLNEICEMQMRGDENARLPGKSATTIFHTSHPQLCGALRRDKRWRQLSAELYGGRKVKSAAQLGSREAKRGARAPGGLISGYGGHFRAVQGYRYFGTAGVEAAKQYGDPNGPAYAKRIKEEAKKREGKGQVDLAVPGG